MNIKFIGGFVDHLLDLKQLSRERIIKARKMLAQKAQIPKGLTVIEVIAVARRQGEVSKKNLLFQIVRSPRYRSLVLPALIRSEVLGTVEEVLNLVLSKKKTKRLDIVTKEYLSPDIFLNLSKKDRNRVVAANHREITKTFSEVSFYKDEQFAIKVLLALPQSSLTKFLDGFFNVSEDARIFESKYISESETVRLINNLNDRRLKKILELPENFLLIANAGKFDPEFICRLFRVADLDSINRFFELGMAAEIEAASNQPKIKPLSSRTAAEIIIEIVQQAHQKRNMTNPAMVAVVTLLQDIDYLIEQLKKIRDNKQIRNLAAAFGRDFAKKTPPDKINNINRELLLIDMMLVLSGRKLLLKKFFESILQNNSLMMKKLLKIK